MSAITRCTVVQDGVNAYALEFSQHYRQGWEVRVCPAGLLLLPAALSRPASNSSAGVNQLSAGR